MMNFGSIVDKISRLGARPDDSEDERAMKAALLLMSTGMTIAAIMWSTVYVIYGRYITAAIPGSYSAISLFSIGLFLLTKRYSFFRFIQLLLILVLPFLVQTSLGGFAQSSAVMLWALLPVMGAIAFQPEHAIKWFVGYVIGTVTMGLIDSYVHVRIAPLPETLTIVFWVGDIGGVSAIIFFVNRYFIGSNRGFLEESRKQRQAAEEARAIVEDQAERLKELDKAKTLFFANISHELRTPLTLLLGPLQSTLETGSKLPGDSRRQLTLAARNGRRLLRQINLLLDFTKAEAGRMELDVASHDPVILAKDLVEETMPAAKAKGLTLEFKTIDENRMIEIDRDRIEQTLLNLLGNAIKFTPNGGRIEVGIKFEGDELVYSVADSGIGIPTDEIPKLFQSFRQAKRKQGEDEGGALYRQEHQGTGLGLALAKQIVELHKGRIDVESVEGKGTTFLVRLPVVVGDRGEGKPFVKQAARKPKQAGQTRAMVDLADIAAAQEGEADHKAPSPVLEEAVAADGSLKPRILVIDDHADVRTYLRSLLEEKYKIYEAADGQEGIERALELLPDIVISDLMMPRKSGFEVVDELKANPKTSTIPIMLLTARSGVEGTVEGLRRGADDYLAKPFDPNELSARVLALLRVTKLERELSITNTDLKTINFHLEQELEAAQSIQESLMPAKGPELPGLEVAGKMVTASQLGGDFYDFIDFDTSNGGKSLGVAIGDVTGHGASSALVTAVAKASLEANISAEVPPHEVLHTLSRIIYDSCKGKKLMTFFYGVVDVEHRSIHFANAGHNFPYLYRPALGEVRQFQLPGTPLGVSRDVPYTPSVEKLDKGDLVILYSDGIVEAASKSNRQYGSRRLRRFIKDHANVSCEELATKIIQDALAYSEQPRPEDDMTVVVMRVH